MYNGNDVVSAYILGAITTVIVSVAIKAAYNSGRRDGYREAENGYHT